MALCIAGSLVAQNTAVGVGDGAPTSELLAQCLVERGKVAEAVPLLRGAVEGSPRNPALRMRLTRALMSLGDFAGAEAAALAWTQADNASADAWFELGRARYRLGREEHEDRHERQVQAVHQVSLKTGRALPNVVGLSCAAADGTVAARTASSRSRAFCWAEACFSSTAIRFDLCSCHEE